MRTLTRLVKTKPFTNDDIVMVIEFAIDDFSARAPFAIAVDRAHGVKNQQELILPSDVLEIVEAYYMDSPGTTLNGAITDSNPPDAGTLTVLDTTDFDSSDTLLIDNEQITYTAKGSSTTFTGITRGANGTTAASHNNGSGVIVADSKWTKLDSTSTNSLAYDNSNWLSASAGTPESFYAFGDIFGFNKAPDVTGYFNVMLRNLVRPPTLTGDTSIIEGLLSMFNKTIVKYTAAEIAKTLGQDEATIQQARTWFQEYLADIALFKQREHMYQRGRRPQVVPVTHRPTGI